MRTNSKRKQFVRKQRAHRIRARLATTADRPRLSVERTLKHIRGQIIDHAGTVLVAIADTHVKQNKLSGVALAAATGKLLAEKAKAKKIDAVVFDKGRYAYHGRVKAFADGAREGGLIL
ncbi:MAG: 50S ribosomal protein L18 [Candidatus Komeilibacteria bacterium]|nr:50S ribosomal protein L18 [Candidatus Komeilibacteria bacterium]